jgi:hypothetical protein
MFSDAVFAFDSGYLYMGSGHLGLHEELSPGGADADGLRLSRRFHFNKGQALS